MARSRRQSVRSSARHGRLKRGGTDRPDRLGIVRLATRLCGASASSRSPPTPSASSDSSARSALRLTMKRPGITADTWLHARSLARQRSDTRASPRSTRMTTDCILQHHVADRHLTKRVTPLCHCYKSMSVRCATKSMPLPRNPRRRITADIGP